ncbi:branched-chain amino acid ABC transporter permease [Nocardioides humi]|uniref:Branched-chain amino acid ABC transporter permease n=1 Tax=Nocardioides humi TaxID=449461 RepID=A0ABN2A5B9_9ACTN|nr:branched-chain amino acid ABC transporter permease [Nocardioides humi]
MTDVVQTIVNSATIGCSYALLAIGLVLVYRASQSVNFGQGELGTLTAFFVLFLIGRSVPLAVALVIAVVCGFAICAGIYLLVVRRAPSRSESTTVLVGTALFLGVNSICAVVWDTNSHAVPSLFPDGVHDFVAVGGVRLYYESLGNVGVLALTVALLSLLLTRTSIGLQMRAVASNPGSAALAGVSVGSVLVLSWGLAGVAGSLAGATTAPSSSLSTNMMFDVLLYGLAGATLGGLNSLKGAVVGGIGVAVVADLIATYVPGVEQELKQAVAMALIIAVLVLRPAGLFGTVEARRV